MRETTMLQGVVQWLNRRSTLVISGIVASTVAYFVLLKLSNSSNTSKKNEKENRVDGPSKVTILYGTVTGTSRTMAHKLHSLLQPLNIPTLKLVNISDYDEDRYIDEEEMLLVICSTWTDGTPPPSCKRFVDYLIDLNNDFRVSKSHLSKLKFAIFGLGGAVYDSNYAKTALQVHSLLDELGGKAILAPMLGDDATNLDDKFRAWCNAVMTIVSGGKVVPALKVKRSNVMKATSKKSNAFQRQQLLVKEEQEHTACDKGDSCCQVNEATNDEEEEEDRINNKFVTMDTIDNSCSPPGDDSDIDDGDSHGMIDMEDLGKSTNSNRTEVVNSLVDREMVTKLQRKALTKEGYRIIGSHSAVKLCRWTKNQMRGRGGCYKHSFYGITSYQCMEATPSLACANKCVFCWRHHKNPVGTDWRWKTDEPLYIVDEAVELHRSMINEMRGVPGVVPERLNEAFNVKHCALSLVGEPIMYPRINELLKALHDRGISSYLVTNAQFPERIEQLDPVTQLYVSVDASTRDSLKAIDRPLFKDFWERFIGSLQAMKTKQQRTVYRMTLVKSWNMEETEGYAELIELGQPDFIEIKAVTYCGKSDASSLTMQNVPWHKEVCNYGEALCKRLSERQLLPYNYSIATEHEHSCCILIAREDKFKVNNTWHTWIDYDKFNQLIQDFYADRSKAFTSVDYMAPTPEWALYQSPSHGFDPEEQRWIRSKTGKMVEIEYKSSESGCG